jgi:hypothetical protein
MLRSKEKQKMTANEPTLESWRRLYEVTARVHALAPWEWMEETDVFGLQHPDTGEYGFVSVMGMAGEHYAIALYLGAQGLYGFRQLEERGGSFPPEKLLQIPQIQASFENREELEKQDVNIIKRLELKFRGKRAWPMFRSIHPGYLPWFVEAAEADFLYYALEQLLEVAPRFKKNPALFAQKSPEKYLMRIPPQKDKIGGWNDDFKQISRPATVTIPLVLDDALFEHVRTLPRTSGVIEIDFFMLPAPVQDGKEERPYFPYTLLIADSKSGALLGTDLLHPDPTLEAMWGQIPVKILELLARVKILPQEMRVSSPLLIELLPGLAKDLNIKFKKARRLPAIDTARLFMQSFGM